MTQKEIIKQLTDKVAALEKQAEKFSNTVRIQILSETDEMTGTLIYDKSKVTYLQVEMIIQRMRGFQNDKHNYFTHTLIIDEGMSWIPATKL